MPPKVTGRAILSGIPAFSISFQEKNPNSSPKPWKTGTPRAAGPGRVRILDSFSRGKTQFIPVELKSSLSQSSSNPTYPSPVQIQFIPVQLKSSLSHSYSSSVYPSPAQVQFIPVQLSLSQLRFKLNFRDLGFFPSIRHFREEFF